MFMLMLAAVLMGLIAFSSMRVELNPDVSFPTVTVNTVYPGAGPDEVSTLVSKKLEDAISGVPNLRELASSSREGSSTIIANFELGANVDVALADVRTRVDSVTSQLPTAVEKPTVLKQDNASQPALYLAFSSNVRNSQQLRDLLDNTIKDRFGQISGVSQVNVQGGDVREIQIQLDKDKLLAYGIGISEVSRQILASTLNVPGGRMTTENKEYSVRVLGEWKSLKSIKDSIIYVTDPKVQNSNPVRIKLSDIATISDNVQERTAYSRLDGKDTAVLAIQKARDGNAVEITKAAEKLIAAMAKDYPDLKIVKTFEQAKQISDSISDLYFTLFFAIFLVSLVVYIFLHNFRGTLIVAIAIPVCIFASLIAASLAGFTINNMTMLALILAVAVLVDDAIVVLENIYRHLKMGEDPRDAAIHGRSEIGLAAIAITMADVVVFLPIAFMGGIVGQFFKPLALTYVFAVVFSIFVSFTITPMLASRWYRSGEDMEHPTGMFAKWFERGFGRLERAYGRILEWSLNHRWFVFILGNLSLVAAFVFIGGGFAGLGGKPTDGIQAGVKLIPACLVVGALVFVGNLFKRRFRPQYILYGFLFGLIFPFAGLLGGIFTSITHQAPFNFQFIPTADNAQVQINVKLPSDSSLARTEGVIERIEKIVSKNENVKYVLSNVGSQGVGQFSGSGNSGSNYAQISATLYDKGALLDKAPWKHAAEKLRWISDTEVSAQILQAIGHIPGAEIKVSTTSSVGFGSPIQISFRSEDSDLLSKTANHIKVLLQNGAIPGVINADVSSTPGKLEKRAIPNREELANSGLAVSDVGTAMRTLYQGDDTARYRVNGNEYKIRVQMSPKDKNNPDIFNEVPVGFKQGRPIFLSTVATVRDEAAVDKIERRDRIQEVQVSTDLLPGYAAGTVQANINTWLQKEKLVPAGVTIKPLGQADAQNRESGFIMGAFGLGLILVYMLLASLYDNLLYPFIVQLAQPQAITGALMALVLTGKPFSLIGFIGLITLIGLVGKNAILLVDYTNTLRGRGRNRHDALVEAGPTRLRPIMMTTIALLFGTLPIAMAIGRGSEFRETIGIVIIGGMVVSTVLTLVLIPCSYTIFDDISISFGNFMGKITGKSPMDPGSFSGTDPERFMEPVSESRTRT